SQISATLERGDGTSECLVDIPDWDFNWQQTYMFAPEDQVSVSFGDTHHLRCVYDNSQANQPVVNGEQLEPRTVTWGEGTLDEMCLNYLVFQTPYAAGGEACPGLASCYEGCAESDSTC